MYFRTKFDVISYRVHNNSDLAAFNNALKEIYENEININVN